MNHTDPIRVLLVEDNESDAFLVRTALKLLGKGKFSVRRVESLNEARVALGNSEQFDVLIGDLNLPDSSPDDTLAFLLRIREQVPVVVLNACDDPDLEQQCADSGAACYSKQKLLDREFVEIVRHESEHATH
jgi:two-component system cell cycle response regulator